MISEDDSVFHQWRLFHGTSIIDTALRKQRTHCHDQRIRAEAYHPEESDKFTGRRWGISILYDFIHALVERDTRRGYIGWHGHHGGIPLATSKESLLLVKRLVEADSTPQIAALLRLLITGALSIVPQHDYYSDTPGALLGRIYLGILHLVQAFDFVPWTVPV
ncbi:hypothetical protein BKA70DRAFT_1239163 [Coprinopsis sp. MPI-PUGE-AT-0042]|nr:hypothetical protein BKA70DRAFT_1239163 [Coprinopsis sp. MPI-PUGE-AT-0042]